ncbi:ABC transporter substrate-binding protein [Caldifermentibacillus hisashii]|uniref:ABC transporter substrate-binding protein n=1 Tax=Caldifermentibacillus hisashii TaxID=996558 RepID=UPI0031013CB2
MKKKLLGTMTVAIGLSLALSACGSNSGSSDKSSDGKETITFINHKTDWTSNGKWDEYIKEFNQKYPDINVKVETITDYAGQMKIRMNSKDYGDVFMLPDTVKPQDFNKFVEPIGKQSELEEKYMGLSNKSYEGTTYGLPIAINTTGLLVNKKLFEEAGIKEFPKTPEDFISALKTIKKKNPDVIPLYTNYASNWAMANWDFVRVGASGNPDITNEMTSDKAPFAEGKTMNTIYKLLYDVTKEGLTENDPSTTDWEQSKQDLADGKIAVMVLGSWAIQQVQDLAENPDDIAFETFPMTAEDGKQYITVAPDYNIAINVNSKHKEAARKFVEWFINDSNYAKDTGAISAVKGKYYPDALKSMQDTGVEFIEANPAPQGKESLFSDIVNASEIGLDTTDKTKQRIVDAAKGNTKESFDSIMDDLNKKWSNAIDEVTK